MTILCTSDTKGIDHPGNVLQPRSFCNEGKSNLAFVGCALDTAFVVTVRGAILRVGELQTP